MWDLCCFISGVSTIGGPQSFLGYERHNQKYREDFLTGILSKLLDSENASLDLPPEIELREGLTELLKGCASDYDYKHSGDPVTEFMHTWNQEVVVIGPSDEEIPESNVSCVQLRVCSEYNGWARYGKVFTNGKWESARVNIGYRGPNPVIFMDVRCWSYLKSWIILPPRPLAADSEISFYTEFFELFKDTFNYRNYPSNKLDYSPLHFTRNNNQQPPIVGEVGVKHALQKMCRGKLPKLRQALRRGIRGKDLGKALLDDFQIWAFESPDIWPSWSEDVQEPIFATFNTTSTLIHPFFSLPFELLIEVFVDTTPYDVLNMASTCRAVRQLLLSPYIFRALLQAMVHRGSLFWLNPSPFAEDEVALANESLVTWINSKEIKAPSNPFQVPSFPFLAFVHTCFVDSFSMRSRRRLWGIIKQVERRWTAFRNGMQLGGEDDPDKWEWTDDREYYDPDVEDFRWRYH